MDPFSLYVEKPLAPPIPPSQQAGPVNTQDPFSLYNQDTPGYYGRAPGTGGSHADHDPQPMNEPEPPREPFDRNRFIEKLTPFKREGANLQGLDDQSLESAYRWALQVQSMGYKPVISSAQRTHGTAGTGHPAGAAIDVGILKQDGSLLGTDKKSNDLEYELARKAAAKAGWKFSINELETGANTPYKTAPHIHLSMHNEGDVIGEVVDPELKSKMPRDRKDLREYARQMARINGINPDMFEAMLQTESGFRGYDDKGNLITSGAGAIGIAQFMPETLKDVEKEFGITQKDYETSEVHQIRAGALWLGKLLKQNGGDMAQALAAYNAGQGGMERIRALGGARGGYDETRHYVKNILNLAGHNVSLDQAESMIINGGLKNHLPENEQLFEMDRQTIYTTANSFFDNMKANAVNDAIEGGKQFAAGLSFGITELIGSQLPGFSWLKPSGEWDKLSSGIGSSLALEIPRIAGMIFTSELIGTLLGGSTLLTNAAEHGSRLHMGGLFGKKTLELPKLLQNKKIAPIANWYSKNLATKQGKLGSLGRFFLGNSPVHLESIVAMSGAEGMYEMVSNFSKRLSEGGTVKEALPEIWTDFFGGAIRGLTVGLALPAGMSALALGTVGTAETISRGADTLLSMSPTKRVVAGMILGGMGGAAFGSEEHGALSGMALGATGVAGLELLAQKALPATKRASMAAGMKSLIDKMDGKTADLFAGMTTDAAAQHLRAQDIAFKEQASKQAVTAFRNSAEEAENFIQTSQAQRQQLQQKISQLDDQIKGRQQLIEGYESQGVSSQAKSLQRNKETHAELMSVRDGLQEQVSKMSANPAMKEQRKELLDQIKDVTTQMKQIGEEISKVSEDPLLTTHARAMDNLQKLQREKQQILQSPEYLRATQLAPQLEDGMSIIAKQQARYADYIEEGGDLANLPALDFDYTISHPDPVIRQMVSDSLGESITAIGKQLGQGHLVNEMIDKDFRRRITTMLNPGTEGANVGDVIDLYKKDLTAKLEASKAIKPTAGLVVKYGGRNGQKFQKSIGVAWDTGSQLPSQDVYLMDAQKTLDFFEDTLDIPPEYSQKAHEVAQAWREGGKVNIPSIHYPAGAEMPDLQGYEALKAAVQSGEKYVPVQMQKGEMSYMKKELAKYATDIHKAARGSLEERILKLKAAETSMQTNPLDPFGEGGLGSLIGGNPADLSQDAIIQRAAKQLADRDLLPVDDAIHRIRDMSPEESEILFRGAVDELNMMFREQSTPSGLRAGALERDGLLKKISEEDEGYFSKWHEQVGKDVKYYDENMREAAMTLAREAKIDSGYVLGATYDSAMDNMYSVTKSGEALSESIGRHGEELFEETVNRLGLNQEGITKFKKRLVRAMEDQGEAAALLKETPEAREFFGLLLDFQRFVERAKVSDPQLESMFRGEYLMHRFPELNKVVADMAENPHYSIRTSKIASEEIRKIQTIAQAEEMYESATDTLRQMNISKGKFQELHPDEKAAMVARMPLEKWRKLPERVRDGHMERASELSVHLLLNNPITDPVLLMKAQVRAVYGSLANRRFLEGLSRQRLIVSEGQELPLLMEVKKAMTVPHVKSKFRAQYTDAGSDASLLQRMGIGKEQANVPYVNLAKVPGWQETFMFDDFGKQVKAENLYLHPDAAHFLSEHLGSRKFSKFEETADTALGLMRSMKLAGTPVPHNLNIWSNQIAEFLTAPFTAMGFFPGGKQIAKEGIASLSGEAAKINAIRSGVNSRTMRQATRLISQELYDQDPEVMRQLMGAKEQGVARMLQAIDPQNPELREMARESMGLWGKNVSKFLGFVPDFDMTINRKMLFESIEHGQLAGFHYRTMAYLDELARTQDGFLNLSKSTQLRIAQKAAADQTNRLAGALPYMFSSDLTRRFMYSQILTPSWFLAKAHGFLQAIDGGVGLFAQGLGNKTGMKGVAEFGGRRVSQRFAHLPPEARQLMAQKMTKTIAAGMMGMVGFAQVASYMVNGHSTFEHPPNKWFHLRVGDKYYNQPLFGYMRDVAKSLGGAIGEQSSQPFFDKMVQQMAPATKEVMEQLMGRDSFTDKKFHSLYERVSHAVDQATAYKEVFGLTKNANLGDVFSTGEEGAVKRLKGKEWLLRQAGVWESDYNAPLGVGGKLSGELGTYRMNLRDQVTDILKAAKKAESKELQQRLINRAYSLARGEGILVKNKELAEKLPGGRLTMSHQGMKNLVKKVFDPTGYALKEANFQDPVMDSVYERIQKDQELENLAMLQTFPFSGAP